MIEVKQFDPKCKEFTANSKVFRVTPSLSIARFEEFEVIQPRLSYGIDFETLFQQDKKMYQLLNSQKFADASVMCHNRMNAVKDVLDSKRVNAAFLVAALAICGEDEDPTKYDEATQLSKIDDWRKEGFAPDGFFYFAASIIKGLPTAYNQYAMEDVEELNLKLKK